MNIILSGPSFYGYVESFGQAFKELGCSVNYHIYPQFTSNFFYMSKVMYYTHIQKKNNYNKTEWMKLNENREIIKRYNKDLIEKIKKENPEIVIFIKGDIIYPQTLREIKNKFNLTTVFWSWDTVFRWPLLLEGMTNYDLFYTFEPTDINRLKKYHVKAKFLPDAFDPKLYHNLSISNKKIDISFVGNMYQKRRDVLFKIVKKFPNLNIQVWGKQYNWYNLVFQYDFNFKMKQLGKRLNNYNTPHEKTNEIYNNSKICLNIHHPQSEQGLSMRAFEIPGSASFQLVDHKESLNDLFCLGDDIVAYQNMNELIKKIDYYLENETEREQIAKKGYETVKKQHTFKHRAKRILSDIKN